MTDGSESRNGGGGDAAWDALFLGIPEPGSAVFAAMCEFCDTYGKQLLVELPWIAADLAAAEGFAMMLAFVRQLGGSRLYVSIELGRFRERIGHDIAGETHRRIVDRTAPSLMVDVPSAWGVFLTMRRIAVRDAIHRGADRHAVARRFGISERSLRS